MASPYKGPSISAISDSGLELLSLIRPSLLRPVRKLVLDSLLIQVASVILGHLTMANWLPASLSKQGLKKNPSLIPLLVITAAGGLWAGYYLWRLAAKSPEVMLRRHTNPEPWNEYEKKQYKFYSTIDHSKLETERPKF